MRALRRSVLTVILGFTGLAACRGGDDPITLPNASMVLELALVAEGLTSPVTLVEPPGDAGRRFVVDQVGLIRVVAADGRLLPEPFLDLRTKLVALRPRYDERGLLGLAFHPDYQANGRFFVYYSAPRRAEAPADFDHTGHLSEFRVSAATPDQADPASERILLQVDQPQFNHNGAAIAFGPDGYLYVGVGDGGNANDLGIGHVEDWYAENGGGNGQDVQQNLLGSILRLDVDRVGSGTPYAIPRDNPFVGRPGLDEIYAYGFRNPHHLSFDQGGSRELIASDAGQNLWEEVNRVVGGGNYGWNVKEGSHCFDAENPGQSPAQCPDTAPGRVRLIDPVVEYPHPGNAAQAPGVSLSGIAVIGGFVYRGTSLPELRGRYVFGDFSKSFQEPSGSLSVAAPRTGGRWPTQPLATASSATGQLDDFLKGFGQDAAGEVYVMVSDVAGPTGATGRVYRLTRGGGG